MNIDRREFLKSIAGLALVPYLKNLNLDSEKVVNQTWEKLVEDPFVFEVNKYGYVRTSGFTAPKLSSEPYSIYRPGIKTVEDLFFEFDRHTAV